MKKNYIKPEVEFLELYIAESILDVGDYSEGWEDAGDEEPI